MKSRYILLALLLLLPRASHAAPTINFSIFGGSYGGMEQTNEANNISYALSLGAGNGGVSGSTGIRDSQWQFTAVNGGYFTLDGVNIGSNITLVHRQDWVGIANNLCAGNVATCTWHATWGRTTRTLAVVTTAAATRQSSTQIIGGWSYNGSEQVAEADAIHYKQQLAAGDGGYTGYSDSRDSDYTFTATNGVYFTLDGVNIGSTIEIVHASNLITIYDPTSGGFNCLPGSPPAPCPAIPKRVIASWGRYDRTLGINIPLMVTSQPEPTLSGITFLTSSCTVPVLTAPGDYVYKVPAGVTSLTVSGVGAGGGGGGGSNDACTSSPGGSGGGGGAAGQSVSTVLSVTPGSELSIHIGAGGAGRQLMVNADAGGNSTISLGVATLLSVAGGAGGTSAGYPGGNCGGSWAWGGLGGSGPGNPGTNGQPAPRAGGSGAGGKGGSSVYGAGGNGGCITCSGVAGGTGTGAGGGGAGGGGSGVGSPNPFGGNGGSAMLSISCTSAAPTVSFSGRGCVLPASGTCDITSWWNVTGLDPLETVDMSVTGPGLALELKDLPADSSKLSRSLMSKIAAVFASLSLTRDVSTPFAQAVGTPGTFTMTLLKHSDSSLLGTALPLSVCSPGYTLDPVSGACLAPGQCTTGLAYVSGACTACGNGGCSGTGGSPTDSPGASLVCNVNSTFIPPSCTSATPPSCTNPFGGAAIPQGSTLTSYSASTVYNPASCTDVGIARVSTCTGSNTWDTAPYSYGSCSQLVTTIDSLTATPTRVRASSSGANTSISWSTTNAPSCTMKRNGVAGWATGVSNAGKADTVSTQTTYTLTCGSVTKSVIVNVIPGFSEF